jgi:hypothetical protein
VPSATAVVNPSAFANASSPAARIDCRIGAVRRRTVRRPTKMRIQVVMLSIISLVALGNPTSAQERTYSGYECTDDCSGHAAGYEWAKEHGIEDAANCPEGNSRSFLEGCLAYAQDPNRADPQEDDNGNTVGEELMQQEDDNDNRDTGGGQLMQREDNDE